MKRKKNDETNEFEPKLNYNLQFFNDGKDDPETPPDDNETPPDDNNDGADDAGGEPADQVSMTSDELNRLVEAQVNKALAKQKREMEKANKKKQKEEDMKKENKWEELYKEAQAEKLETENKYKLKELESSAMSQLAAKQLAPEFNEFISVDVEDSAEEVQEKVDKLHKLVESHAQRLVEDLRNSDPRGFKNSSFNGKTKKKTGGRKDELSAMINETFPKMNKSFFK